MGFDPDFRIDYPAVRQTENWSCSACSWAWLAGSIGVAFTEWQAIQKIGYPSQINPQVGLVFGDGRRLAEAYSEEPLLWPSHYSPTSWSDALRLAEQGPLLLGGHGFYHWVAVRGRIGDVLWLANPSPNWFGCGDDLDSREFASFGPWDAVWLAA